MLGDDLFLPLFYFRVDELDHLSGIHADHVIMVPVGGDFEYGMPAVEIVAYHAVGSLKLSEYAIDSGQADVFPALYQRFVYVFGAHMLRAAFLEDFEDPQPRQRRFQAGFLEVVSFQFAQSFPSIAPVTNSSSGPRIGYTPSPHAVRPSLKLWQF